MPRISDPILIRNLEIKNRLFSPPIISNLVREDCCASKQLIDATYYRAKGGWGLYSVEGSLPNEETKLFPRMLGCYSEDQVIALYELVEAIHGGGARAMMQVTHPGRMADPDRLPPHVRKVALAPSDTSPPNPFLPHIKPFGMSEEDIEKIIQDHVKSIQIAKTAGFDIYELHCSHGTLPQQFMSPYTNHRTDKWGGSWPRRLEFICQLISRMRESVGDFPIACRVAGDEYMEGGYDVEDFCKYIAPAMEEAGCDLFDVTAGVFEHFHIITPELYEPRGVWAHLAERVKQVVKVPVAGLGRINTGKLAIKYIEEGRFDMVGIGRGSMADADFARKVIAGRFDDIRQCIACNTCTEDDFSMRPSRCAVNFSYNRSADWQEERMMPAREKKHILVVGGGPAGMEYARVATLRGHRVTLCEKTDKLGGYVPLAASFTRLYTAELMNIIQWLKREIARLGISVSLNMEIKNDTVEEMAPDAVVLATGSKMTIPDIPGIDAAHVITLDDYLRSKKPVGRRVAVLGGHYGAEAAVSLARIGKSKPEDYSRYHKKAEDRALRVTDPESVKEVFLLEPGSTLAFPPYSQMNRTNLLLEYLQEAGVTCRTGVNVEKIGETELVYTDESGSRNTLAVDTSIVAWSRTGNRDLYHQIAHTGIPVWEIGDCAGPEKIEKAIHMANYAARQV